MATDTAPRSCPFCGSSALEVQAINWGLRGQFRRFAVWCDQCGVKGPQRDTPRNAVEAWNWAGEPLPVMPAPEAQPEDKP